MKTAFVHIKNTVNTGDKACTPYHYFDFPEPACFDLKDTIPDCDTVIYGGGAIEPKLRNEKLHHNVNAKHKIAWGIGTSRSRSKEHGPLVDDLDLCGVREVGREVNAGSNVYYVPCVSCMSPLFDIPYKEDMEISVYKHAAKDNIINDSGLPTINNRAPLDEAIEFMGRSHVIVTNSFHGVYWATMLGKKVICFPFSSKFYGYKYSPSYANKENWRSKLNTVQSHPEALDDCRALNIAFYNDIKKLIGQE